MTSTRLAWRFKPASVLASVSSEWDELQSRALAHAFMRSVFIRGLLQHFGTGRELLAFAPGQHGWRAATILVPGRWGRWTSFQPSQLPLGPVLMESGLSLNEAVEELLRQLPGFATTVGLTQLDLSLMPPLVENPRLRSLHYIDTAWVDIDCDFETYWEARGKNLRQNTRKQLKKVEAAGTPPALDVLSRPEDVAQAVAEYGVLEASGWKAEAGTAIQAGTTQGRFYQDVLEGLAAEQRARIYRYRFGTEVVAMDLCVQQGEALVILKTAYQAAHQAISPSTLMRHDQFAALFAAADFKRIEFYGRVMEWHSRWTDKIKQLTHVTVYRWGWFQSLHRLLSRGRA